MVWLFVTMLWLLMLLSPLVLLFAFLPSGRRCPRCSDDTVPVRARALRPIRGLLSRRWCMACGWDGITRSRVSIRPLPSIAVRVPEDVDDPEEAGEEPWKEGRS